MLFAANITTDGDWMIWGSLTLLSVLGLVAVWSDRWFRGGRQEN